MVQLFSPESNPNHYGFSPRPTPSLDRQLSDIGGALMISEGIDRDRAVDESGNQLAVFGRRGARPLNAAEAAKLFMRGGKVYTVTNDPPGRPAASSDSWLAAIRRYSSRPGLSRPGLLARRSLGGGG